MNTNMQLLCTHSVHLPHQTQTCSSLRSLCTPVIPNTNMSLLYTQCVHLPHHTYMYSTALIKYTCNTKQKHVAPPSLHLLSTPETPNSSGTRRRSSSSSSSTSSGGGMQRYRQSTNEITYNINEWCFCRYSGSQPIKSPAT